MSGKKFRFLDADPKKRPPNYSSKSAQRKLLFLIGSLFFVVYAMDQVRRPESWEWLEAMDREAKENLTSASSAEAQDRGAEQSLKPSLPIAMQQLAWLPETASLSVSHFENFVNLEQTFWRQSIERLSPEEQFAVVDLLGSWASSTESQSGTNDLHQVALSRLRQWRQTFRDEVKRRAAFSKSVWQLSQQENVSADQETTSGVEGEPGADRDGAAEPLPQAQLSGQATPQLFELPESIDLSVSQAVEDQSRWLLNHWNSLVGDQAANSEPPATEKRSSDDSSSWKMILTRWVDPILLELVQDGSRLGRAEERGVWLRLVQRAMQEVPQSTSVVSRQNLMGQSAFFRGKWVSLEGTLRRVEKKRQTMPEVERWMQQDDYLVAWVQPGVKGQGPFCVYCLNDPALEEVASSEPETRRLVRIEGIFFKLFPYPVSETETTVGPALLANHVNMKPVVVVTPVDPPDSTQWGLIVGAVVSLAAVLGLLAWRSTRYRTANPIGQRLYRSGKVEWLNDETVDSVGESLKRLADEDDGEDRYESEA